MSYLYSDLRAWKIIVASLFFAFLLGGAIATAAIIATLKTFT